MVLIAVLLVAQITMLHGSSSSEEDEARFTLRDIMKLLMKKRI
jgi:hypothetical protein